MPLEFNLTENEARVLGVLIEKEATTPDAYPLSLNAIVAGSNQKSSREPVLSLSEAEGQAAINGLLTHTLAGEQSGSGGRVQRYGHRLASRLFGKLEFDAPERAVLCLLLLRGPQTAGEIRSRCARMHAFDSTQAVDSVLARLASREDGPYVAELPRESGRRESRFAHLLCGDDFPVATTPPAPRPAGPRADEMASLQARLEVVENELAALKEKLQPLLE